MPDLGPMRVGETHALDNGVHIPHRMDMKRPLGTHSAAAGNARAATEIDRVIGAKVRQRRTAEKLSQEKLAELIGVTFQQIQKYEKGVNRVSAATLYRIAQALRVPIAELLPPINEGAAGGGVDVPTVRTLVALVAGLNNEGRALLVSLARSLIHSGSLRAEGTKDCRL